MKRLQSSCATLLLALSAPVVVAQASSDHLKLMRETCAFYIGDPVPPEVVRSRIVGQSDRFHRVLIDVASRSPVRRLIGSLEFLCPIEDTYRTAESGKFDRRPDLTPSPSEIIEREDSAGRYFRHILWERRLAGVNWVGRVAYSDFTLGDGQRDYSSYMLMCHATKAASCVSFIGDAGRRLTSGEVEKVLEVLRALRFHNR